jgi:hypothetical protein
VSNCEFLEKELAKDSPEDEVCEMQRETFCTVNS